MMWLAGWHEICLCSRQPSYPGMVPSWKSKWWMFFRLWTVFLSSGLFVRPPPTGRSGRAAIQTGVLHTLERSNTAMSLQMQCRTVSLRTGRLVLAYLFHLSIILMHTISIHWCMTAVIANVIGQAGWKRLKMWSLSQQIIYLSPPPTKATFRTYNYIFSHLRISNIYISTIFSNPPPPLLYPSPSQHAWCKGMCSVGRWVGEVGLNLSIPAILNIYNYNISKIHKIDNISNTRYLLFFSVTSTSKFVNLQHIRDSQITKYSQHFK